MQIAGSSSTMSTLALQSVFSIRSPGASRVFDEMQLPEDDLDLNPSKIIIGLCADTVNKHTGMADLDI
jgi:hypothetical protein